MHFGLHVRSERVAAQTMEEREASHVVGPDSDAERLFAACCGVCCVGCGPYLPVATIPCRQYATWHRCLDLSTPVNFRAEGERLVVRTRSNVCFWDVEEIAVGDVESVGVYVEDTAWVSSGDRPVYALEFSAPVPVKSAKQLKRSMPRSCADDGGCDRCCETHLHCAKPAGTPLMPRPYFPACSLGAVVRGRSGVTRLSRRRWLPADVDAMERLAASVAMLLARAADDGASAASSDEAVLHLPRSASEDLLCPRVDARVHPSSSDESLASRAAPPPAPWRDPLPVY